MADDPVEQLLSEVSYDLTDTSGTRRMVECDAEKLETLLAELVLLRAESDERAQPAGADGDDVGDGPIHSWFGLTYSSYLVVPRSIAQSMPHPWQQQLVDLIEQARRHLAIDDAPSDYMVRARKGNRLVADPYRDYQRGRRRLPRRSAT